MLVKLNEIYNQFESLSHLQCGTVIFSTALGSGPANVIHRKAPWYGNFNVESEWHFIIISLARAIFCRSACGNNRAPQVRAFVLQHACNNWQIFADVGPKEGNKLLHEQGPDPKWIDWVEVTRRNIRHSTVPSSAH